jgi:hypothetical protein
LVAIDDGIEDIAGWLALRLGPRRGGAIYLAAWARAI